MTSIEEADSWIGRTAVDDTGEQVGMISQIWVDDASGRPAWASVSGPALGAREAVVPLAGAVALGGGVQFRSTREEIVDAPQVADDGRLDLEEKERLCAHYGTADNAEAGPPDRTASWADRIHDMTDPGAPASPPTGFDPAAPKKGSRFQRKPRRPDPKVGRRFGRKPAATDQPLLDDRMEPDEVPLRG